MKEPEHNTLLCLNESADKLNCQILGPQLRNIGERGPTHSLPNSREINIHTCLFEQFIIEATGVVEGSVFQHVVSLGLLVRVVGRLPLWCLGSLSFWRLRFYLLFMGLRRCVVVTRRRGRTLVDVRSFPRMT